MFFQGDERVHQYCRWANREQDTQIEPLSQGCFAVGASYLLGAEKTRCPPIRPDFQLDASGLRPRCISRRRHASLAAITATPRSTAAFGSGTTVGVDSIVNCDGSRRRPIKRIVELVLSVIKK